MQVFICMSIVFDCTALFQAIYIITFLLVQIWFNMIQGSNSVGLKGSFLGFLNMSVTRECDSFLGHKFLKLETQTRPSSTFSSHSFSPSLRFANKGDFKVCGNEAAQGRP